MRRKYQKTTVDGFCLLVNLIDSVLRAGKNYYSQVFLEMAKKDVWKIVADNLWISSDKENSDEENYGEKISNEENYVKD